MADVAEADYVADVSFCFISHAASNGRQLALTRYARRRTRVSFRMIYFAIEIHAKSTRRTTLFSLMARYYHFESGTLRKMKHARLLRQCR